MYTRLVEIQPREIKFTFELKKQSSCAVHLANVTDQYVAFKVKTTSPKKYCVRPNVGIIKPKSTCDFTVTMQAQKSAPPEMQCKDKFLIQSTLVPFGTIEDDITPGMFVKDSQKYIEEIKLRVVLASAPSSPEKPLTGVRQELLCDSKTPKELDSPMLLPVNGVTKQEPFYQTSMATNKLQNGSETPPPDDMITKKVEPIKSIEIMEEFRSLKVMDGMESVPTDDEKFYPDNDESKPVKDVDETKLKLTKDIEELGSKISAMGDMESVPTNDEKFYPGNDESKPVKDVDETKLKLTKDIEELGSKISAMGSSLVEAKYMIEKLGEEKSNTIREREILKAELAILRRTSGTRITRVGFPPLFVCMVALISLLIGSLFRA